MDEKRNRQEMNMENQADAVSQEKRSILERFTKKQNFMLAGTGLLVVAFIIGLIIYNMPSNSVSRYLNLGYRYLEDMHYEEAVVAFNKAISIDERCLEAYTGGIKAYQGAGDVEGLAALYEDALMVVGDLDEAELDKKMDTAVEIYLTADDVYSDDPERATQVLEDGLKRTGDERIKGRLVEDYLDLSKGYTDKGDYDKALEIYDRLLELDAEDDRVQSDIGKCLEKYLNLLIEQGRYSEARALIEKYRDKVHTVDFQAFLDRIAGLEQMAAENDTFLQRVYDLMAAEDYEALDELYASEETSEFLDRMEGDSYIYIPENDGGSSGTGAGVYWYPAGNFREAGYYFYYGSYIGGSREGIGKTFNNLDDGGYEIFSGQWRENAPNGDGEIRISYAEFLIDGGGSSNVYRGNLVNGLWNGPVEYIAYYNGVEDDLSFTAVNGVPQEDKTEEAIRKAGRAWVEESIEAMRGDAIVGAIGTNFCFFYTIGSTLGVTGFSDVNY